jgi:hypothetical protein
MAMWEGGSKGPPVDVDVIESGSERRPGQLAVGWVLLLVVVAGVVGYWVGSRHRDAAVLPGPPSVAPAVDPPIVGTGKRCSEQVGERRLQLGVEVVNQSAAVVGLRQLQAALPMGGLRAGAATWGSCGQLPSAGSGGSYLLAAKATTWLTMSFDVLVACPGPLPVLFTVEYVRAGAVDVADLPGFPDLGDVPYRGAKC